jgi:ubiquinone/menaquinone biosynthesis C-methylase UbiE
MDSKKLSQQRFGQFAQGYVSSKTHARGGELDTLVEIAQPASDWQILDVATGGGHTALRFAPHVAHVIASDLTQEMLNSAEAFITAAGITNVSYELADAENLPFPDQQFDLVTCRIAPHHFPDVLAFVQQAVRVLKSGGMLLVQDQMVSEDPEVALVSETFERLRDPSHHRAYSQADWISMFKQAELEVIHTETITKRHQFESWAALQACSAETIAELRSLLREASDAAKNWMKPENWDTPEATFINHHLIIAGRKGLS